MADSPTVELLGLSMGVAPVDDFLPNPWNPNRMDERTYEAERESIRLYGFIDPATVRPHPEQESKWELLDGEHRWKAAKDEGLTEISYASTGPIPDTAAKKLTIIFNETRGDADVALLGRLLSDLNTELDREDLQLGLAFSDGELKNLIEIGSLDWGDFGDQNGDEETHVDPGAHKVILAYADDDYERFQRFSRMVTHEHSLDLSAAILVALEYAARDLPAGEEDSGGEPVEGEPVPG